MSSTDRKLKMAWKALQHDPALVHRASVRLAHCRTLPCKQTINADTFFPPPGNAAMAEKAKRLCDHCPYLAQLDCLVTHLAAGSAQQHGISAGTSPKMRSTFINREHRIEQVLSA